MDDNSLDGRELEDMRPREGRCQACGGHPTWEQLVDRFGERWFAICRCGSMHAFLPDQPGIEIEDPLAAFLRGPGIEAWPTTPPWIRLFVRSFNQQLADWRFHPAACPACANTVCFWLQAFPRPFWLATCSLCLACGRVTSEYSQPWNNRRELPLSGSGWAPPSPAVQRLRDCIYRPYSGAEDRTR